MRRVRASPEELAAVLYRMCPEWVGSGPSPIEWPGLESLALGVQQGANQRHRQAARGGRAQARIGKEQVHDLGI